MKKNKWFISLSVLALSTALIGADCSQNKHNEEKINDQVEQTTKNKDIASNKESSKRKFSKKKNQLTNEAKDVVTDEVNEVILFAYPEQKEINKIITMSKEPITNNQDQEINQNVAMAKQPISQKQTAEVEKIVSMSKDQNTSEETAEVERILAFSNLELNNSKPNLQLAKQIEKAEKSVEVIDTQRNAVSTDIEQKEWSNFEIPTIHLVAEASPAETDQAKAITSEEHEANTVIYEPLEEQIIPEVTKIDYQIDQKPGSDSSEEINDIDLEPKIEEEAFETNPEIPIETIKEESNITQESTNSAQDEISVDHKLNEEAKDQEDSGTSETQIEPEVEEDMTENEPIDSADNQLSQVTEPDEETKELESLEITDTQKVPEVEEEANETSPKNPIETTEEETIIVQCPLESSNVQIKSETEIESIEEDTEFLNETEDIQQNNEENNEDDFDAEEIIIVEKIGDEEDKVEIVIKNSDIV